MTTMNRQVLLASRPSGPVTEANFRFAEVPIESPREGEVLVRNDWLSLDPYMAGRMIDARSYEPPAALDAVMVGQTVGTVVGSRDPAFDVGDTVLTQLGWQRYGIAPADALRRVDASRVPASYYLGVCGMPGITAWLGLNEIGKPKAGETLVVSAASGAVGSVVGQLAKLAGCRAVGIAGGREKCEYVVDSLGFDACIDRRSGGWPVLLRRACPGGVDIDFENVGGEILDSVLRMMNPHSRVVLCGLIAEYGSAPYGHTALHAVLVNRIRMQGIIVLDWKDRYAEASAALCRHVESGEIKCRESIVEGLDNAPRGLIALLRGENFGKQIVRVG
jgi:NADPH-dependent curcumin reductase